MSEEGEYIDVKLLKPWHWLDQETPSGAGEMEFIFNQTFSMREKLQTMARPDGASMGEDADFDARQTMCILAKMVDQKRKRAFIQLEDQTEAMVVDLVAYKGLKVWSIPDPENNNQQPIIFLRYAYHTRDWSNPKDVPTATVKAIETSNPNGEVNLIQCASKDEMAILVENFKANASKIPPEFRSEIEARINKKFKKIPNSYTSFLTPVHIAIQNKAPKGSCKMCGAPSKAACAKCKITKYCGKECQRRDWKEGHKNECKTPETVALETAAFGEGCTQGETSEDSPWVDIDPGKLQMPAGYMATMSMNRSSGLNPRPEIKSTSEHASELEGCKRDKVVMVKVQVQPFSHMQQYSEILVYPQGKKFEIMATPTNIITDRSGYRKLYNLVKSRGFDAGFGMGGCKIYLDAYVKSDGLLRVMLNKVHAMQKW